MKRKTAIKKLMGIGYSRNMANRLHSFWRDINRYHNNSCDVKRMELLCKNRTISRQCAYSYYGLEVN